MITSGELPGLDLPDVDAHGDLSGLGEVELHHPTADMDADGVFDTETAYGSHSIDIWTDMDHDGVADHVTIVDVDGDYAAWEYHRQPDGSAGWMPTDRGHLGA